METLKNELTRTEVKREQLLNSWVTFITYEKSLYKCILSWDAFSEKVIYVTQLYTNPREPFQELLQELEKRKDLANAISRHKEYIKS